MRDTLAAAVRLNLVGPMRAVALQHAIGQAVRAGGGYQGVMDLDSAAGAYSGS